MKPKYIKGFYQVVVNNCLDGIHQNTNLWSQVF